MATNGHESAWSNENTKLSFMAKLLSNYTQWFTNTSSISSTVTVERDDKDATPAPPSEQRPEQPHHKRVVKPLFDTVVSAMMSLIQSDAGPARDQAVGHKAGGAALVFTSSDPFGR